MNRKIDVDNFLRQKKIALLGCSRSGKKFGNIILKDLQKKGFTVYPIHPQAKEIDGKTCYASFDQLPEKVSAALFVIPPSQTEQVVYEAKQNGVRYVWMQQGSESENAVKFCIDNNISVIAGECILMFAEPVGFGHNIHRWIWKVLGKLPK